MLTTQVALVPLEPHAADDERFRQDLLHVAAALQTQLTRDFQPIWGIPAVISPFLTLEDVPPDWLPLVVVQGENAPGEHHGFHFAADGRPFGLVFYDEDWSLSASHELLELIADPAGQLTKPGPSLQDEKKGNDVQGVVDYLVEVCDPCEDSPYEINGVRVSEFVTPRYYDTFSAQDQLYSFLGTIKQPFELLTRGYISWRTRHPRNSVWQAHADPEKLKSGAPAYSDDGAPRAFTPAELDIFRLRKPARSGPDSDFVSRYSRDWVDSRGKRRDQRGQRVVTRDPAWERYGSEFRSDVELLLEVLNQSPPPPTLHDTIRFLHTVGYGGKPTAKQLTQFNLTGPPPKRTRQAEFDAILDQLKKQEKLTALFGPDLFDPDLASWLCRLTF